MIIDNHSEECSGAECEFYGCYALPENNPVVAAVVKLWNDEGGWLPGCSYGRLAEALGVDPDALTHYKPGIGRHYPAADHTNGGLK
jgi:hypothetical protein